MSCMTPLRVLCDVASGLSPEAFRCLRYSAIYAPDMLPRPRTLPAGFIAPCLPTKAPQPPSGALWLHEIKHDGFRVIARKDGERVKLYSRPGNDLTWRFPLIVEAAGPPALAILHHRRGGRRLRRQRHLVSSIASATGIMTIACSSMPST